MPLEQAVLEHHSLGIVETPDGPRTRVVVVAARRDMIERLLQATRKAGLRPHGIDLSAFAMIRALHRPGYRRHAVHQRRRHHEPRRRGRYRPAPSPASPARASSRSPASSPSAARSRSSTPTAGSATSACSTPVDEIEGDADIVAEAREVLSDGVRRIADEVRNSLDFHAMQDASAVVERVVLTGPAVAIPGFPEQLGEEVGLPLEVGVVQEGQPGGFGGVDAGRLAVAAGLTVEEIPS